MPFDLTILTKKIEGLKQAFENGRFADALVGALNTGNGLMQQRIFTRNQDIEGNSFGVYIGKKREVVITKNKRKRINDSRVQSLTTYEKKRVQAGRQIIHKDLEFTGGVRRAIETQIENEKSVVLEFNNDEAATIAHGQEQQITNIRNGGKGTVKGTGAIKIFKLNIDEKEKVVEQGHELILQILKPKP
jgi:hypothetical protein